MKKTFPKALLSFAVPLILLCSCSGMEGVNREPKNELIFRDVPCVARDYTTENNNTYEYFGTFVAEKHNTLYLQELERQGLSSSEILQTFKQNSKGEVPDMDLQIQQRIKGTALENVSGQIIQIGCTSDKDKGIPDYEISSCLIQGTQDQFELCASDGRSLGSQVYTGLQYWEIHNIEEGLLNKNTLIKVINKEGQVLDSFSLNSLKESK